MHTLHQLMERIRRPRTGGHAARLMRKGLDKALQKFGEESVELIIAAKCPNKQEIIEEAADVIYHLCVVLNMKDIDDTAVWDAIQRRLDAAESDEPQTLTNSTKIP